MEKKQGLNNVQRKMLDEIYTEQFESLARPILQKREEELKRLKKDTLEKELSKNPLKSAFSSIRAAEAAKKGVEKYLQDNGLRFSNRSSYRNEDELEIDTYGIHHPKIAAFEAETEKIQAKLAKKRKEIRARVYGMDTTYELVENEIKRELEDITK